MSITKILYVELSSWLTLQRVALVVLAVGAFTWAVALCFEHIGGFRPCELCLKERVIYYVSIVAGLLAYVLAPRRPALAGAILALCGVGFLANTVLAAYHAGVEWHFWTGPSSCTGLGDVAHDVSGLLSAIKTERPVPCDVAQFRFLGISFAGYDALLSLGMALFLAFGLALHFRPASQTPSGVHL